MKNRNQKKPGKLQTEFTRNVMGVVFAAFLLIFCIVLYTSYNYYRNQEINYQRNQLEKTAAQINTIQNTVYNIAQQAIYDDVVQQGIAAEEESTGVYLYLKRKVNGTLTSYSHIMDSIQEVMIYTDAGKTFSSREVRDPFQPEKNPWYMEFLESGRISGFTSVHRAEAHQDGYSEDVISYIMNYYTLETGRNKKLGELVVNIRMDALEEVTHVESELLNGYCLYDSAGNSIIYEGEMSGGYSDLNSMDSARIQQTGTGNVLLASREMGDGWILVSEISGMELMKRSLRAYSYLLVIFLVIFVVLFVVLQRAIRRIVAPVNQLSEAALKLGGGDFDVSVRIRTNNELEMLADVFNKMVVDIKKLMHESVEHEKVLRRMEIENLMLQINPHFIYNTMNSIVYMARMSGNSQIADFANAFISLLQNTLHVRDSIYNTVRSELNTVESYLCLQKYRYADKFTYEIHCPEELLDCQVLNVMLQPAVENAIFHGIAPKDQKGSLLIEVSREGDALKVCIEDDGIGMTPEILAEQMRPGYTQKGGVRKIGVANVRDRIHEIYGKPYSLEIESQAGVGTRVIMTVPYIKEKQDISQEENHEEENHGQ